MSKIKKGDYVLVTKNFSGNSQEEWAIGYYDYTDDAGKHYIVDESGTQYSFSGFKRMQKISFAKGKLLAENKDLIKAMRKPLWWWIKQSDVSSFLYDTLLGDKDIDFAKLEEILSNSDTREEFRVIMNKLKNM